MHHNRSPLKIIGRYAASYTIIGLASSIFILTARNIYREITNPSYISSISTPEQWCEYLASENKLYGTIFSIGSLTGLVMGTILGIKRSNSPREQDKEHEECSHCHYHL